MNASGNIFIVSSPSGAGKGTILSRVLTSMNHLRHTVSATTRPPRAGEKDGEQYRFLDQAAFEKWVAEGKFAEWARVHEFLYGTPKAEFARAFDSGCDVVLELDVQGMRSVKQLYPEAVSIFIMPPSMEELERRIRKRGGVTEHEIAVRLRSAEIEIAAKDEYDHVVFNEDLERAIAEFENIVEKARTLKRKQPGRSKK